MQEIELPDGTVLEFPPGMGDDEIRAAVQSYLSQKPGGSQPAPQSYAAGLLDQFTQGASMGFGDEATALEAALLGRTPGGDWFNYSQPFGERYNTALEAERGQQKQFQQANPTAATAANIGGAVATAMTPIGAVGQAIGAPLTGANLARGVAAGAGYGGLYGFGEGEGGLENRLENVPVNAAIGAAGGAAGNVLQAGAGRLGRMLTDPNTMRAQQMGIQMGILPETYRIARSAAEMADVDVPGGGQAFIRQGGPDAMIGDVMTGELDTIANVGAGAPIARRNLNARTDRASLQVAEATNKALGKPRGRKEIIREIMDSTREARKNAYDEAFDTPIDYTRPGGREIEDVLNRVDPDTLRRAMKMAEAELRDMKYPKRQFKINILDDGAVEISEVPSVLQMDQLKRALDDIASQGKDKINGTVTAEARLAAKHAREIREALAANNENYRAALAAGKDAITQREGRELGAKLLNDSTYFEDVAEFFVDASPADIMRIKQGARSEMAHRLGNVRRTRTDPNIDQRQAMKAIGDLTTPNNKEKMRLILGEAEADQFFAEIDNAARTFNVRAATAENSKTARRTQFGNEIKEAAGRGRIPDRPVASIVDAVGSLPARGLNALTGRTQGQIMSREQAIQRELAELITGLRGEDAIRAFQQLLSQQPPPVNYQGPFSRRLAAGSRLAAPPAVAPLLQP